MQQTRDTMRALWRLFGTSPRQPKAVTLLPGVRYAVRFPRNVRIFNRDDRGSVEELLAFIDHRRRVLSVVGSVPRALRQARWEAQHMLTGETT